MMIWCCKHTKLIPGLPINEPICYKHVTNCYICILLKKNYGFVRLYSKPCHKNVYGIAVIYKTHLNREHPGINQHCIKWIGYLILSFIQGKTTFPVALNL